MRKAKATTTAQNEKQERKNVKRSVMFHGWDENYIYIYFWQQNIIPILYKFL